MNDTGCKVLCGVLSVRYICEPLVEYHRRYLNMQTGTYVNERSHTLYEREIKALSLSLFCQSLSVSPSLSVSVCLALYIFIFSLSLSFSFSLSTISAPL